MLKFDSYKYLKGFKWLIVKYVYNNDAFYAFISKDNLYSFLPISLYCKILYLFNICTPVSICAYEHAFGPILQSIICFIFRFLDIMYVQAYKKRNVYCITLFSVLY